MSRKGKLPVVLLKGVEASLQGNSITVKGPKGSLIQELMPVINVAIEEGEIRVSPSKDDQALSKFVGLYRTLIDNMVIGVSTGFEKHLKMIGVGFRAAVQGRELDLQVGFSHPTKLPIPEGIEVKVEKNVNIVIMGSDKRVVGQFAADVRSTRPPEPYQGKGIRYKDEYVRRKAGKSASAK
jgi:large subunit ribosomal protein L6